MRTVLALIAVLAVTAVAAQDACVSDTPPRTALVYDVYSPLYGRLLPEVKRNTNFQGQPLTLDGRTSAHGFGGRGYSIIELDVPQGATCLTAVLGVDDHGSAAGNGTYFSVWADGLRLWQSPAVRKSDPAISVTIPLGGKRTIKLISDAQGYGNQDLADWCDARWLCDAPPPRPLWEYTSGQPWQVRAELHPFSLVYRGEKLPVTVLAPAAGPAALAYTVTSANGVPALAGNASLALKASEHARATAITALDLTRLPNGLFDLRLDVTAGGQTVVRRTVRFGFLVSRLGQPSNGTIFGVNHHESIASCEALAAIGCEYSRQWFCWAWIEPKPGEWHWNWHDERTAEARRFGLKTIGVLGGIGSPAWSSPSHVKAGEFTTQGCPADMAAWEEYVRAVATRYKGQVTVWESWNEIMGLAQSGLDGWSVANYVDLHRRTYRVLKAVDPNNRLLLSADALAFVQACLDAGVGDTFDGIVPHPYRGGATPEAWVSNGCVGAMGDVQTVFTTAREWLAAHQHPTAGTWATEIGWAVSGRDWVTVPVQTHGEYVPRTYQLATASGQAANLSWHDFAHDMFGLADPNGVPRPALLSYAGMVPRLTGATLVRRTPPAKELRALVFRRGSTEVITLCAEHDATFAFLKPATATTLKAFDWYGNESTLALPAAGRAVAVDGRIMYLEGPRASQVRVSEVAPLALTPPQTEALAGDQSALQCSIENVFGAAASFTVVPGVVPGLRFGATKPLGLGLGQRGEISLPVTVAREAVAGNREVALTVTVPGGVAPVLRATVHVLPAVSVALRPFDCTRLGTTPRPVQVQVHNNDRQALAGKVALEAPPGMNVEPAALRFADLAARGTQTLDATLTATRPATPTDSLTVRVTCADGAHCERAYSLAPTVLDRDSNGVADGWKLNPEGGPPDQRNLATASVEPGDSEFFCQKITCTRFGGGWIILHRDGQDHVRQGRRYRVTYRARSEGLRGTVGVAVYNVVPWQSCGLEAHARVGADWETVTNDFTATRDSDSVRFEVYFTEVGTLWVEGMRLEELPVK